jgi:hypothetical protein
MKTSDETPECSHCREETRRANGAEEKLRAAYVDSVMFQRSVEDLLLRMEKVRIGHDLLCHAEEGGPCACSLFRLEEKVREVIGFLSRSRIGE